MDRRDTHTRVEMYTPSRFLHPIQTNKEHVRIQNHAKTKNAKSIQFIPSHPVSSHPYPSQARNCRDHVCKFTCVLLFTVHQPGAASTQGVESFHCICIPCHTWMDGWMDGESGRIWFLALRGGLVLTLYMLI